MLTVKIDYFDRDIEQLNDSIRELQVVIEEIRKSIWILQTQSVMDERMIELIRIRQRLEEDAETAKDMVRALERIRESYQKAETRIIDSAESNLLRTKTRKGLESLFREFTDWNITKVVIGK